MNIQQLKNKLEANTYNSSQLQGLLINYSNYAKDGRMTQNVKDDYLERIAILKEHMKMQGTDGNKSTVVEPQVTKETLEDLPEDVIISRKYLNLHQSAKKRGKDFNLTFSDVKKLLSRKTCYYTGMKLSREEGNSQLTIDRIEGDKGYIKGNVVACSHWANQIKNSLYEDDRKGNVVATVPLYGMSKYLIKLMTVVEGL